MKIESLKGKELFYFGDKYYRKEVIKQRVEWLLKEIDEFYAYKDLNEKQKDLLEKAVKKAFSGVVEE